MAAEETQDPGRERAFSAQGWLESTTRIEVPWIIIYEHAPPLRIERPDGTTRHFDLGGSFRSGSMSGREFEA